LADLNALFFGYSRKLLEETFVRSSQEKEGEEEKAKEKNEVPKRVLRENNTPLRKKLPRLKKLNFSS